MSREIEVTVSEDLINRYAGKDGIVSSVFDLTLVEMVREAAEELTSQYPELRQKEHAHTLVTRLSDTKRFEASSHEDKARIRAQLLVASFAAFKAD